VPFASFVSRNSPKRYLAQAASLKA
jgi:hypothetical protein